MRTLLFRQLAAVALLVALAQGLTASAFGQEAPSIEACPAGQVGAVLRWSDGHADIACVTAPSKARPTQTDHTPVSSSSSSISTSVSKSTTCINGSCTSLETTSTCIDGSCTQDQDLAVDDSTAAETD